MKAKAPTAPAPDLHDLAVDTLGAALRSMGEFAQDVERADADSARKLALAWAQHVLVASPPPAGTPQAGRAAGEGGRRDWEGVRRFVHDYCRSSSARAASVAGDLREVIWVFVKNFGQAIAVEEATDERLRVHLERLEQLAVASDAAELRREVAATVGSLTQALEERRARQRAQMASLGDAVRALGDELATARRDGETDALTRLHNRKAFDAYLDETLRLQQAFRGDAALLLVDVDHFKGVNDTCGHLAGDAVLCAVADALSRVFLRRSDFVARYGGDEFAVVLRDTAVADAARLADRLLERVRALEVPAGAAALRVSVSIGAGAVAPGDDARRWFERADRGLYAAKAAGRGRAAVGDDAPQPTRTPSIDTDPPSKPSTGNATGSPASRSPSV